MKTQYRYTIENCRHEPHELDDEVVYFYFDIHYSLPEPYIVPCFYSFAKLLSHLQTSQPAFYEYIITTRRSLDLWGPREKTLLDTIGEEALTQLYQYLYLHLEEINYAEVTFVHHKKLWATTQEQADGIRNDLASMAELATGVKEHQQKYRQFCELAQRKMREVALEVYPEIGEMEPEQLKQLRYLFTDEIMAMHGSVKQLLKGED